MNRAVHVSLLLSLILVLAPAGAFAKQKNKNLDEAQELVNKARQLGKDYDYTGAVENLTRAAELGSPIGMNNLATYFVRGLGTEKDEARALELYRQAAKGGDQYAMWNLGLAYRFGSLGAEQDEKAARAWLKKAVSGGVKDAKKDLDAKAPEPAQREIREAREAKRRNDYEAAASLYRAAAEKGNSEGQEHTALAFRYGYGAVQNFVLAREWYLKAAKSDRVGPMAELGNIYRHGLGTDIDEKAAKEWLGKAAKKGFTPAAQALAKPPASPLSDVQLSRNRADQAVAGGDYTAAISVWKKNATGGDLRAQYNLGWAYQHGLGVTADSAKATRYYRQAATGGHGGALRAIIRLAEQGDAEMMVFLGEAYLAGKGVEVDGWLGREWLLRAQHMGNERASKRLEEISPLPTGGGREEWDKGLKLNFSDRVASRQWYVKAAGKGHIAATSAMGDSYVNGEGVPRDYALARLWFSRAARAGNAYAQQNYAGLLVEGLGGPQDAATALFWFQRAAEQDNQMAAWALGRLHSAGTGVPKNEELAIHWFEIAADMGSVAADRELINRGVRPDVWKESVKKAREDAIKAKKEREARKESGSSLFGDLARIWAASVAPSYSIEAMNSGPGTGTSDAEWWAKSRARSDCLRRVTESVQRATYGGQSWRYVDNCR